MDETRSSCPLHDLHKIEHLLLAAPSLVQPVNPPSTPALAIHSIVLRLSNISIQSLVHSFIDSSLTGLSSASMSNPPKMPVIALLKTQSTRRQEKGYTSLPPLSRKNSPRPYTPNYSPPSSPHPPFRSASPGTSLHRTSEPTPPVFSNRASPISRYTTSLLTPSESVGSETKS